MVFIDNVYWAYKTASCMVGKKKNKFDSNSPFALKVSYSGSANNKWNIKTIFSEISRKKSLQNVPEVPAA